MGLRDKIESKKDEKKQAAQAEAEAVQVQEKQDKEAEEGAFQQVFAERNALRGALDELRSARGELAAARGTRSKELRHLQGMVDELKAEDPEAEVPTVREAVAADDRGEDEERYLAAKEEVRTNFKQVRTKLQALRELGVEAEGLSDQELEAAVEAAYQAKDREAKAYARAHPESELTEAQEVRAELVEAVGRQLTKHLPDDSWFHDELQELMRKHFLADKGDSERVFEPRNAKYLQENLNREMRQVLGRHLGKNLEYYTKALKEVAPEDQDLATEALSEYLVAQTAGAPIYGQGEGFRMADEKLGLLIGAGDSQSIPDEYRYDDRSGFNTAGKEYLRSKIDRAPFREAVGSLREVMEVQQELEALPRETEERVGKAREYRDLEQSLYSVQQNATGAERDTRDVRASLEELRWKAAQLELDLANVSIEGSISISGSGDRRTVALGHYDQQVRNLRMQLNERKNAIDSAHANAVKARNDAKRALDSVGWKAWQKSGAEAALKTAEEHETEQKRVKEHPRDDDEYRRLSDSLTQLDGERSQQSKPLSRALEGLRVGEVSGGTWEEFRSNLKRSLENAVKRLENRLAETEKREAEAKAAWDAQKDRINVLKTELGNRTSPEDVRRNADSRRRSLEEQVASRKGALDPASQRNRY